MDLFVYGTLQDQELRNAVAGPGGTLVAACLHGYGIRPLAGSVVPVLVAEPEGATSGLLWSGLNDDQCARLALYEGAFGYHLIPVTVTRTDGTQVVAQMWSPPEEAEAGRGDWSLSHWQTAYGAASVLAAEELFSQIPRPTAAMLRWQFPMMQKRAWNRVTAARQAAPATLRHAPEPCDLSIDEKAPLLGGFFRLQAFGVSHRRFDQTWQQTLPREVFVGIDAVLVLPYDPVSERVVLVEQLRMGAAIRDDNNPWVLEPVAGMIDAFESPEQAALRETREEAGLDVTLRHVASCYPSPGNATDFFYTYIGLCSLPEPGSYHGGLATEQEDLRLHILSLDDALALVETGEINAGPGIMLLYWLAMQRSALRLEFAPPAA